MNVRKNIEKKIAKEERELEFYLADIAQSEKLVEAAERNIERLKKVLAESPERTNGKINGITEAVIKPLVIKLLERAGTEGISRDNICERLKDHLVKKDPQQSLIGFAIRVDSALRSSEVEQLENGSYRLQETVRATA